MPKLIGTLGRERCDSEPSRNRTTSESSNQSQHSAMMPPPRVPNSHRPHSMYVTFDLYLLFLSVYIFNVSFSSILIKLFFFFIYRNRQSGACSESDGSSLSIDEPDSMHSMVIDDNMSRYLPPGTTIIEENLDDNFWLNDNDKPNYENSIGAKSNTSLSLPISQSQSFGQRKGGSPAPRVGSMEGTYMDMYSPCGSSPGDQNPNYLPMSPGMDYSRG